MKTFRHWQLLEDTVAAPDGHRYHLRAWGGSNIDGEDALAAAVVRLAQMQANVAADALRGSEEYGYGNGVVREEMLVLLAGSDTAPEAVITRNRYGAPVLNAVRLFIADIDFAPAKLSLKFWSKPVDPAIAALEAVRAWSATHGACVRTYRTPNGLRVIRTDRAVDAESNEAMDDLQALGSDPLYRSLCKRQGCFRARLGPKPWRIGLGTPHWRFPRDAGQSAFGDWLAQYEEAGRGHAACRYVETMGAAPVAAELEALVRVHDEQSGALSERPLA